MNAVLPPGFVLDDPPQQAAPLPPGFVLDQPPPATPAPQAPEFGFGQVARAFGRGAADFAANVTRALPKTLGLLPGMGLAPGGRRAIMSPEAQAGADKAGQALADLGPEFQPSATVDTIIDAEGALPTIQEAGKFIAEQGARSVPGMAAVMFRPTLPTFTAGEIRRLGDERAVNEGRPGEAGPLDYVAAAPAAIANTALELFGARGVLGIGSQPARSVRQIPGRALAAAGREAGTEAIQEGAENVATTAGTARGFNLEEFQKAMLGGAIAGAGMGGSVRAAVEGTRLALARRGNRRPEDVTADEVGQAVADGDQEIIQILRDAGATDEQIAAMSEGFRARAAERVQARQIDDAVRPPRGALPDEAPGKSARDAAVRAGFRADNEIQRQRDLRAQIEARVDDEIAAGLLDPAARDEEIARRVGRLPMAAQTPDVIRVGPSGQGAPLEPDGTLQDEARGVAEGMARAGEVRRQIDRQAEQAFALADRQRRRRQAQPETADTRAAGRPEGRAPQQVLTDEDFPVRILSERRERRNGQDVVVATVERYDPRTGQAEPDAQPYEVLKASLRARSYSIDPRRAQEFEEAAQAPIVSGGRARGRRADEVQGLPRQTFRTTEPDPNEDFPAAGEGRSPIPPQGEGPSPFRPYSTAEEAMRDFQARQEQARQQGRASEEAARDQRARERYAGAKFSNTPRAAPEGRWEVDEDGYVASDKGGPVIFGDQKQAARWILKQGQNSPDQIFEIANHPVAAGRFTVRQRGRREPPPGGGQSQRDTARNEGLPPPARPSEPQARRRAPEEPRVVDEAPARPEAVAPQSRQDVGSGDQRQQTEPPMTTTATQPRDAEASAPEPSTKPAAAPAFFAIKMGGRDRLELIGVFDTLEEAKAATAKESFYSFILDVKNGVKRDNKGRKASGHDIMAENLLYALRTGEYVTGAEIVGIDPPGIKPEWQKTVADKIEEFNKSDDDFTAFDREQHRFAVEMAVRLGKPVPAAVLADFPDLTPVKTKSAKPAKPRGFSKPATYNGRKEIRVEKDDPINDPTVRIVSRSKDAKAGDVDWIVEWDAGFTSERSAKRITERLPTVSTLAQAKKLALQLYDRLKGAGDKAREAFYEFMRDTSGSGRAPTPEEAGRAMAAAARAGGKLSREIENTILRSGDELARLVRMARGDSESGDGFWGRVRRGATSAADLGRIAFYANASYVKVLANRYAGPDGRPNPAIMRIHDMFFAEPGTTRTVRSTYGEDVERRGRQFNNRLNTILAPFQPGKTFAGGELVRNADSEAALNALGRVMRGERYQGPPEFRDAVAKAAGELRQWLNDMHAYLTEAGVRVGFQKNYLPTEVNLSKALADPDGFKKKAAEAFMASGVKDRKNAAQLAEEWLRRIQFQDAGVVVADNDFVNLGTTGTGSKFERARVLDARAHAIMGDFLHQNPADLLPVYTLRAVRRAEWIRRMGTNLEGWAELKNQLNESGAGEAIPDLVAAIQSMTDTMSGAHRFQWLGSTLSTWNALKNLSYATLSSLSEVFTPAIRSGNAADAARSVWYTTKQLIDRTRGHKDDARALAEDLGFVSNVAHDSLMSMRFGSEYQSEFMRHLSDRFFYRIGLHQFTEATAVASMRIGQMFIRRLAKETKGQSSLFGSSGSAAHFLRELGVDPSEAQAFADWVLSKDDGFPSFADMQGARGADAKMAKLYVDALWRFKAQSIIAPNAAVRPRYAQTALGRVIYQLQSFLYGFHKNVLARVVKSAYAGATGRELGTGAFKTGFGKGGQKIEGLGILDRFRLLLPLALLPMTALAQYALIGVRDKLLEDPARDPAKRIRAEEEKLMLALSRAGWLGAADPLFNLVSGVRYKRDPATAALGPSLGSMSELVGALVALADPETNSPNTNAAERRAARMLYDVVVKPTLSAAGAAVPGGPVAATLGAALIQVGAHPATRERALVRPLAGPPGWETGGGTRPLQPRLTPRLAPAR